jgi:hypothetical protein
MAPGPSTESDGEVVRCTWLQGLTFFIETLITQEMDRFSISNESVASGVGTLDNSQERQRIRKKPIGFSFDVDILRRPKKTPALSRNAASTAARSPLNRVLLGTHTASVGPHDVPKNDTELKAPSPPTADDKLTPSPDRFIAGLSGSQFPDNAEVVEWPHGISTYLPFLHKMAVREAVSFIRSVYIASL